MTCRVRWLATIGTIGAVLVGAAGAGAASHPIGSRDPGDTPTYGWIFLAMPIWADNCPAGGVVTAAWARIGDTWEGGDTGDDLVYGRAILGIDQQVVTRVRCQRGAHSYAGATTVHLVRPTATGQTWWVGPGPAQLWHN